MAPLLSLAMPVRNGERYLAAAIDSIRVQTFADYELIVLDNASTDATPDICRRLVREDRRIRYVRNPVDLGAGANFNSGVELASGDLFKWCAHDDLLNLEFLEHCVRALWARPLAVTAYGRLIQIATDGNPTGYVERPLTSLDNVPASQRFKTLVHRQGLDAAIFGVHRRSVLVSTSLHLPYYGSDCALLAELALFGPFVHAPQAVLYSRDHPSRSVNLASSERLVWQAPVNDRANAREFTSRVCHLFAITYRHRDRAPFLATVSTVLLWVMHPIRLGRMMLEAIGAVSPRLRVRLRSAGLAVLRRSRGPSSRRGSQGA